MGTQCSDQSEILCVFDSKGKLILTNDEFQKSLGYDDVDANGYYIYDFVGSNAEKELKSKIELVNGGRDSEVFNINLKTKQGNEYLSQWELMRGEKNVYAFISIPEELKKTETINSSYLIGK